MRRLWSNPLSLCTEKSAETGSHPLLVPLFLLSATGSQPAQFLLLYRLQCICGDSVRLPDKSDTRFPFTGESCDAALRAIGFPQRHEHAGGTGRAARAAARHSQRWRSRNATRLGNLRPARDQNALFCTFPQPHPSPSFLLPSGAAFVLRHASDRRTRFFPAIYCGSRTSQVGCGQRQSPRTAGLGARADLGRRGLARGDWRQGCLADNSPAAPVRPDCC